MKYYDIREMLKTEAHYYISMGNRSAGKSYSTALYCLEQFYKSGYKEQMVILRRYETDIKGKRASLYFDSICHNDEVSKITNGEWTSIYYWSGKYFLTRYDEETDKVIKMEEPFAYIMSLADTMHDKSLNFPNVTTVVFEEFIDRNYITDETSLFFNQLSTIIRHRTNVKVILLGNTVNRFACPYFTDFGISKLVKSMEPGNCNLYINKKTGLKIYVEYTPDTSKEGGKKSDIYFDFENSKSSGMIIQGTWETAHYPHLAPGYKILPKHIVYKFYLRAFDETVEGDVVHNDEALFIYFHKKTTELKELPEDLIFQQEFDPRPNYRTDLLSTYDKIGKRITDLFRREKVFYQSNEVGELVWNFVNND